MVVGGEHQQLSGRAAGADGFYQSLAVAAELGRALALAVGDEVVTAGGILGKVTETSDNFLTVEIANGVQVKVQRHPVTSVLPKGTLKSA